MQPWMRVVANRLGQLLAADDLEPIIALEGSGSGRTPAADPGRRRPSWLTVAIVGAVCSAVVGPILAIIARGITAAHPQPTLHRRAPIGCS